MQPYIIDKSVVQPERHAALFVDFDQMLNCLRETFPRVQNECDLLCNLLHAGLNYLERECRARTIVRNCYADFELLAGQTVLQSLHLMGFETSHCMRMRNGRDLNIPMVIDTLETLHKMDNIEIFVLVAHDLFYIDLIRAIQERAKRVLIIADPSQLSGDLRYNAGKESIINMEELIKSGCSNSVKHENGGI